jgi:hypothetical protein
MKVKILAEREARLCAHAVREHRSKSSLNRAAIAALLEK